MSKRVLADNNAQWASPGGRVQMCVIVRIVTKIGDARTAQCGVGGMDHSHHIHGMTRAHLCGELQCVVCVRCRYACAVCGIN